MGTCSNEMGLAILADQHYGGSREQQHRRDTVLLRLRLPRGLAVCSPTVGHFDIAIATSSQKTPVAAYHLGTTTPLAHTPKSEHQMVYHPVPLDQLPGCHYNHKLSKIKTIS
jgi:hypothetical protein